MSTSLIIATILITLALIFYSLGVWSARITQHLKSWQVAAFWTGFAFDVAGTWAMHKISEGPFNLSTLHALTGQIALWLMFAHTIWATVVVNKGSPKARQGFHRYSFTVWLIWLIPYFGGMYIGMNR